MSAIKFPSNPVNGQQYSAPNGIVYTFDSIKWVGAVVGSTINSIGYGTYTIYINTSGNLVIPNNSIITQQSGSAVASTALYLLNAGKILALTTSGTVIFPDGTVQTTAYTGTISYSQLINIPVDNDPYTTTATVNTLIANSLTNYIKGTTATLMANAVTAGTLAPGATVSLSGLSVSNNATFSGPVTFSNTATYVLSTNTVYTDNIIELHVPPGGVNSTWSNTDGRDIGLRMHYYSTSTGDANAALVLAQDTGYLEWYGDGSESNGVFSGSYGRIKTGGIVLANAFAPIKFQDGSFQNTAWTGSTDRLTTGSYSVILGTDGNLTLPVGMGISQSITWAYGGSQIFEDSGLVLQGATGVAITSPGTTQITADSAQWNFVNDSTLILPALSGQIGRSGYTNGIDLYNDNGTGYVRMNYADQSFVWVDSGGAHVQTSGGTWDFGTDGGLTLPSGLSIDNANNFTAPNQTYITLASSGANGSTELAWSSTLTNTSSMQAANIELGLWSSGQPGVRIHVYDERYENPNTLNGDWQFDYYGRLTFPDGTSFLDGRWKSPSETMAVVVDDAFVKITPIDQYGTPQAPWTFSSTGTLTFPNATVQSTAYTGTGTQVTSAVTANYAITFNTGTQVTSAVNANNAKTVTGGVGVYTLTAGTGTAVSASSGTVTVWNTIPAFSTATQVASAVSANTVTGGYIKSISVGTGTFIANTASGNVTIWVPTTQGTTGAQGVTGAGTQGTTGAQGVTGTGTQGTTGAGTQGTTGAQGVTGTGTQGTTGAGTQGTTGAQGITGSGSTTSTLTGTSIILTAKTAVLGAVISGELTSNTYLNRLMFQTTVTNAGSSLGIIPNGTPSTFVENSYVANFVAYNSSNSNNTSYLALGLTQTDARISTSYTGASSYVPMTFYTSNSERLRVGVNGQVTVNTTASTSGEIFSVNGSAYINGIVTATNVIYANTLTGIANTGSVQIQSIVNGVTSNWTFNNNGTTGTITFPDSTVQTTAYLGNYKKATGVNVSTGTVVSLNTIRVAAWNGYLHLQSNTATSVQVVGQAEQLCFGSGNVASTITATITTSTLTQPGILNPAMQRIGDTHLYYITDISYNFMYRVTGMLTGVSSNTNYNIVIEQLI